MKKMMLTIVLLTFFSFWMLPADSKMITQRIKLPHSSNAIPLSTMEESVDDMYDGCYEQMKNKVDKTYFPEELKDKVFSEVWNGKPVSKCVAVGLESQKKSETKLSEDQIQAICAYTAPYALYKDFNEAVQNGKKTYPTTAFRYHTLQFHLTDAVQTLKNSQGDDCLTSYRRTDQDFTGDPNKLMRFGQFASSSKDPNLYWFGKKTCFEMTTCYGADLKYYPILGDSEKEVLIPPYEVFKIVEVQKEETMKKCDKVFKLKSTGKRKDLNCKAA